MSNPRAPRDWLQAAIDVRGIAAVVMNHDAKRLLEDLADDCELMAQKVGQTVDDVIGID
jgi:hypothetical protein